ncbi:hypothetical protein B0J18DRAFT_116346 [Chaetomium sp. MPI-SDFR-AT-0129]|nr:hypothetical protein B0J18DRAFT_116346 [Chaetomium sp. MPI-SDFR-AT-0129]
MEPVSPPRAQRPSSYRYTWDENGKVAEVTRIRESRSFSAERLRLGHERRKSSGQWRFQNIAVANGSPPDLGELQQQPASPGSPAQQPGGGITRRSGSYRRYRPSWQPSLPKSQQYPDPYPDFDKRTGEPYTQSAGPGASEYPYSPDDVVPDYLRSFIRHGEGSGSGDDGQNNSNGNNHSNSSSRRDESPPYGEGDNDSPPYVESPPYSPGLPAVATAAIVVGGTAGQRRVSQGIAEQARSRSRSRGHSRIGSGSSMGSGRGNIKGSRSRTVSPPFEEVELNIPIPRKSSARQKLAKAGYGYAPVSEMGDDDEDEEGSRGSGERNAAHDVSPESGSNGDSTGDRGDSGDSSNSQVDPDLKRDSFERVSLDRAESHSSSSPSRSSSGGAEENHMFLPAGSRNNNNEMEDDGDSDDSDETDIDDDDDVGKEKGYKDTIHRNSSYGSYGSSRRSTSWQALRSGWRAGVALTVLATLAVLIAGFVCLMVAISGKPSSASVAAAVYVGACGTATAVNMGVHAAITVAAVVLLAGANYVFQVLSSPTRAEVDAAHRQERWVDIGVPSLRNLKWIGRGRAALAVLVVVMAVLTQVLYHAVVFVSQTAPSFKAAMVGEPFVRGAAFSGDFSADGSGFSRPDLLALQRRVVDGDLVRLSAPDCMDQFGGAFETAYSAVLLVSDTQTTSTGMSRVTRVARLSRSGTDPARDLAPALVDPSAMQVQYCLALPAPPPTCQVNLNASLLGIVALLNSIAVVATSAVLFRRRSAFRPLVTLGDAFSSFLQDPDPTTRGACLLTKSDVVRGRTWPRAEAKYWIPDSHYWARSVPFTGWLATFLLWALCAGLAAAALVYHLTADTTSSLSALGLADPHALIRFPFTSSSTTTPPPAAIAVLAAVPQLLLAALYLSVNSLLTTYYLSHESSLFAMGGHPVGPVGRPLRVSADPVGAQTTGIRLTLPHVVSCPLTVLFAGMSFLTGQSFFAVVVRAVPVSIPPTASPDAAGESPSLVALGTSGQALVALLIALGLLALAVITLGMRRAPSAITVKGEMVGNPMVMPGGSCSAVVSARCQPVGGRESLAPPVRGSMGKPGRKSESVVPVRVSTVRLSMAREMASEETTEGTGTRTEPGTGAETGTGGMEKRGMRMEIRETRETALWRRPVMWGVIREGNGYGVSHCGFTAGRAGTVGMGRSYA